MGDYKKLDDLLSKPLVRQTSSRCGVKQLLEVLPEGTRSKLETAMADEKVPHAALARAIKDAGITPTLTPMQIGHHRRHDCLCKQ